MKTIRIKVYKFSELSGKAQVYAIKDEIKFHLLTEDREDTVTCKYESENKGQTFSQKVNGLYMLHNKFFIQMIEDGGNQFTADGRLFTENYKSPTCNNLKNTQN